MNLSINKMVKSSKILIIDDEPRMCKSLMTLLCTQNYEVVVCNSGSEALTLLAEDEFDLILLDIIMKEMGGFQVFDKIMAQKIDTPVIIMTAHSSTESAVQALRMGAADYLKKPFESEELFTSVKNTLNQKILKKENESVTKRLNKSEKKYRDLLEGLNDAAYRMSLPDGQYEYFSQAAKTVFGYDSKQWLTNPAFIKEILHPDFNDYFKEKWADLLNGKVAKTYEYKIIDHKGNERWIFQSNTGVFNDQGKIIAIEGLCRNITEHKRSDKTNKVLIAISNAVNSTQNLKDIYKSIHSSLGSILDVTNFFIALVNTKEHTLNFPYHVDTTDDVFAPIVNFDTDDSLTGLVISQRKPILLTSKDLAQRKNQHGVRGPVPLTWMGAPLIIKDEIIGVVAVQSYLIPNLYDKHDLQILSTVSNQIAIAIDRKRTEESLITAYRQFEDIIEFLPDPTFVINKEKKVVAWNRAIEKLTGIPKKNVLNQGDNIYSIPFWGKPKKVLVDFIMDREDGVETQYNYLEKDNNNLTAEIYLPNLAGGKYVWLKASPLFDREGNLAGAIEAIRDITENKKTEEKLRASEERLKIIFNASPDPIVVYNNQGYPEYLNEAFTDCFGWYLNELRDQHIPFVPEEQKEITRLKLNEIYQSGDPVRFETKRLSKHGIVIDVLLSAAIIKDIKKINIGLVVNLKDITGRKEMETHLQQTQKMESIGTLAGGIAHDFNNILFPVLGHTEMLLQDIPEDNPIHNNLKKIYAGANRAKELVKQILTFSRQKPSELRLIKIQPLIKEALKLIRATIPTTIDIKHDIQSDCGMIKADPTQIHQIVMNLTTNAYHAMEETGGRLQVNLKEVNFKEHDLINPDMAPGKFACLTVADTGAGIDEELTDKIFDPFFTTKEVGKGTGMGLSVVHGIVKSMNGVISVYSEPDKRTEFNVYFPIQKKSYGMQDSQTNMPIQTGTEQILLVDDEEEILIMEKKMLERLGYKVTSQISSIEALEAFKANPDKFNMVITDMAMPDMAGDKLAIELSKTRPDIPILLCTGFSETISKEKAASLGIKGFLLKPIVMQELSHKIREVLNKN